MQNTDMRSAAHHMRSAAHKWTSNPGFSPIENTENAHADSWIDIEINGKKMNWQSNAITISSHARSIIV